jgi:ribonuclease D
MKIILLKNDIDSSFCENLKSIAIDTETMGLLPYRDRLCLIQMSKGDDICYAIQTKTFEHSDNLKKILADNKVLKIFHYARFDMMMLYKSFNIMPQNVYCTKIASKLARTFTNKHSLQSLCENLLGIEISKEQTCTDWGAINLTDEQKEYAAIDVLYLHKLKEKLDQLLLRENRKKLAQKCFDFLETRVILDLMCGFEYDIFKHH